MAFAPPGLATGEFVGSVPGAPQAVTECGAPLASEFPRSCAYAFQLTLAAVSWLKIV